VRFLSMRFGVRSAVLGMALVGSLLMAGCASNNNSSSSGSNATATPVLSPGAGTYNKSQTVTIADTNPGAVLYCTTDGTIPTTSSPQCSQPTTVYQTEFLQAIAVAPGKSPSAVVSAGYTIDLNAVPTPTFSPAGAAYSSGQQVTIGDTLSGANIYYTTDGTVPMVNSTNTTLYTGPIALTKSVTLSAIAIAPGYSNSGVASAAYTISAGGGQSTAVIPTFSLAAGIYTSAQTVTISDATPGAAIYYTLDGSQPSTASMLYSTPLTVSATETISAIASAPGFNNSGVASAAYTISAGGGGQPVPVAPTFSPAAGTYTSAQTVTISDATPGAAIYYTLDGSQPSTASTLYSTPLTVSAAETINAIAATSGGSSSITTSTYSFQTPAPVISPGSGALTPGTSVSMSDAVTGATIYYTTNGGTPNTTSTKYTAPFPVSTPQTINAIAYAVNGSSPITTVTYTINTPTAAPVISPAGGTFSNIQSVSISDATSGAAIYYTLDGSQPSEASTPYSGPFTVSASETVNTIAIAASESSTVTSVSFTISLGSSLSGKVFSGLSAVGGAQVQLYGAGQTGYGSAPTALGPVATTASDGTGSFTVNFTCPPAPGDQVYLVATGGNAGAGINSKLVLLSALGSCGTLTAATPVMVNEVTTVASTYALAQFAVTSASGPGIQIGTSAGYPTAGNYQGLASAMKTVRNLVNLSAGTALSITPFYQALGSASGDILNSSYVPQARINTLAEILNACVSSNGTAVGCSNLFSAVTPTTPAGGSAAVAPTDTLQAILDIALNPGSNADMLYGLASAGAPLGSPAPSILTSAPTDWTLALTFTGGGLGVLPGATQTAALNAGNSFAVTGMALDAGGNVWLTTISNPNDSSPPANPDAAIEFDNQGNAISTKLSTTAYAGGYQPTFNGTPVLNGNDSIVVDLTGDIWIGGSKFTKMTSSGTVAQGNYAGAPVPPQNVTTCGQVNSMVVDASNDLWAGCVDPVGDGMISEMSAADGSPIGAISSGTSQLGLSNIGGVALDLSGNLWGVTAPFAPVSSQYSALYQVSTSATPFAVTNDHTTSGGTFTTSVVVDGTGDVFSLSSTLGKISVLAHGQTAASSFTYPVPALTNLSIQAPVSGTTAFGVDQLALDGAGNLWGASYAAAAFGDTLSSVPSYLVELSSSTGSLLSPSGTNIYGYTGTGGGGETQPILANVSESSLYPPIAGIAVDGSGNIWVANNSLAYPTYDVNPPGQQLVEFIGLAAPVYTPAAAGLQAGAIGIRP
jgi:Chitobiase/beta-hexosaminidase C-terminal domain